MKLVRLVYFSLFCGLLNSVSANTFSHARVVYTLKQLLVLSNARLTPGERLEIPTDLRRRRRVSSAGVRRCEWKRVYKPSLPSVITGNGSSLPNNMEELAALTRLQWEHWECSLTHFTETWLNDLYPDSVVHLDYFIWSEGTGI